MSPFIAPIVLAAALAPEAGSRFVVVQGVRVHYQGAGAGKRALVLIHGGACDTTLWRNQVALLAAYGRVLVLDLPGHGLSDKPERVYDVALFLGAVDAELGVPAGRLPVLCPCPRRGQGVARQPDRHR